MPYSLSSKLFEDSALFDQASHFRESLNSGLKLPADFRPPVEFRVDLLLEGRRMPTLFIVPAFVARKPFYEALVAAGADNVDPYPAIIRNDETGERFDDYLLLNVVGLVACADLDNSEYAELGPGLNVIDSVAIEGRKMPSAHIFRLAEDPLQIIVSDSLYHGISIFGFEDLAFEPVMVT